MPPPAAPAVASPPPTGVVVAKPPPAAVVVAAPAAVAPPVAAPPPAAPVVDKAAPRLALATASATATMGPGSFACVVDARGLADAPAVYRRLREEAVAQGVAVAASGFVVVRGDPARSLIEPPPLLCRAIAPGARLRAPLLALLVDAADVDVVDRVSGSAVLAGARALKGTGRQLRAVLDADGAIVAMTLLR